jgi:hypothetical protein
MNLRLFLLPPLTLSLKPRKIEEEDEKEHEEDSYRLHGPIFLRKNGMTLSIIRKREVTITSKLNIKRSALPAGLNLNLNRNLSSQGSRP